MELKFTLTKATEKHADQTKRDRMKWPFKDMGVGDEVLIETPEHVTAAQTYAHTYAAKTGRRFTTVSTDMGLVVVRVA